MSKEEIKQEISKELDSFFGKCTSGSAFLPEEIAFQGKIRYGRTEHKMRHCLQAMTVGV